MPDRSLLTRASTSRAFVDYKKAELKQTEEKNQEKQDQWQSISGVMAHSRIHDLCPS